MIIKEQLEKDCRAGLSRPQLANKYGASLGTMGQYLKRYKLSTSGKIIPHNKINISYEQLLEDCKNGLMQSEMGIKNMKMKESEYVSKHKYMKIMGKGKLKFMREL